MKKLTLALGAGALALAVAGGAVAQQAMNKSGRGPMQDPFGNATITRADAQGRAAELFAKLDANRDGKLDREDREARRSARVDQMFDRIDANHDGRIDKAEFTTAHSGEHRDGGMHRGMNGQAGMGQGRMGQQGMMRAGMKADANGDGAISRDEFISRVLKRFDAADANKDGKLTADERRAAMRSRMGGPAAAQ